MSALDFSARHSANVLETLGLAEVEHFPKNNRMRAIDKK